MSGSTKKFYHETLKQKAAARAASRMLDHAGSANPRESQAKERALPETPREVKARKMRRLIMTHNSEAARARAEALFKKTDAKPELGVTRQTAEDLAAREKIARLRALRLTKHGSSSSR